MRLKSAGSRIRYVRTEQGLTLEQLAEKAGIAKSFLWEVEHDRSDIGGERLLRVANALGASLEFLLRGEPAPKDYQRPVIEIPGELGELAQEISFTYQQTLALLDIERSVRAWRSVKSQELRTKKYWRKLYDSMKPFLEEKQ